MESSADSMEPLPIDTRMLLVRTATIGVIFFSFQSFFFPQAYLLDEAHETYGTAEFFRVVVRPSRHPVLFCAAAVHDNPYRVHHRKWERSGVTTAKGIYRAVSARNNRAYAPLHSKESGFPFSAPSSTGMPRRLSGLVGRTVKRLSVWQPVERDMPSINLDLVIFVAGDHGAAQSSAFEATLEDVLTLFFRWFDADGRRCAWPLQGLVSMESLQRVHKHYGQQMVHDFNKKQEELREEEDIRKSKIRSVEFYTQLGAIQRRIASWFFDGSTFHRRGPDAFVIPKTLVETDVDFFRGFPFNLLHVTHGVYSSKPPASVDRLEKELALRGVNSLSKLLSKTNFFDLFILLDIFDECFAQIDVLREYVANWKKFVQERVTPAEIPRGAWKEKQNLEEYLTDPRRPRSEFPSCSTLKCTMRYSWQKTPDKIIEVTKKNVNSLKLLVIGSTGIVPPPPEEESKGWFQRLRRFFSKSVLEKTIQTMKAWHRKEKADAVLGLGDILGLPPPTSVQDRLFDTKWYIPFIKGGGLDVPWLMALGDNDAMLSPSTQIRYHYTRKHHNWHMPSDYYTVTFKFDTTLTLAEGFTENEQFNTTVINLNSWELLVGNPVANNMEGWTHKLHWLSNQLYAAAEKDSTWVLVTGHHPVISTGPEGEQARLQYVIDLYKTGRPRGVESRLVQLLFLHYQVDAYISAHDYLMEYIALKEKDSGVTVSFISSGAGARLLGRHLGGGWTGRLRGALSPALCWAGRKILFILEPGGCHPLWHDKEQALRFFAPSQDSYEVDIVERVTRKHGFVALKLSKDSMVVEFIDSHSGKPAAPSVYRKSNKAARSSRFLDPYAAGKMKYEELLLDREAFARENRDLIDREVEFYRRCPVLAQRINLCVKEINEIVDHYNELAQQKEGYETMDDAARDIMMAQGTNVLAKTSQILGDMYTLSNDYRKTELLYVSLVKIKNTNPTADHPRWKELLDLETRYAAARKRKRELTAQLTADDAQPDPDAEHELNEEIKLMKLLRKEMDDIEADIEGTAGENTKDGKSAARIQLQEPPAINDGNNSELLEVKSLDTSVTGRIKRKEALLRRHRALLNELRGRPKEELVRMKPEIEILKRQMAHIRHDLMRLRQLLQRSQSPMLPSRVWMKFKVKGELEHRLRQLRAYLFRVSRLPPVQRFSREVEAEVKSVETEKAEVESELTAVLDELSNRKVTPLQALYLEKESELVRERLVAQLRNSLSAAELEMPGVEAALRKAEERQDVLEGEVEVLHGQVEEELAVLDAEWKKSHTGSETRREVGVGPDVEQLNGEESRKVLETNELAQAAAALQVLKDTQVYVSQLQEAVRLVKTSSPDEVKEIETQWGPVESLPQKLFEAKKRVEELEGTLKQMEVQLERDAPTSGKEAPGDGGATFRRLDELMSWFKEKREPSPYKKLKRIETGPMDPCLQVPFLEAAVKHELQHGEDKDARDSCVYELANQVYREQRRYIHAGVFFSQTDTGLVPALFDRPSVHVERGYSAYFGYTHLNRFKSILKDIRKGIEWINEQINPVALADIEKHQENKLRDRLEEESRPPGELELEWREENEILDEGTGPQTANEVDIRDAA